MSQSRTECGIALQFVIGNINLLLEENFFLWCYVRADNIEKVLLRKSFQRDKAW